jgi:hypothetical protein
MGFSVFKNIKYANDVTEEVYQLPDDPPPPEDPSPPEKLELPDDQDLPDPPDDNMNPPIEAFPLVRRSSFAFSYHLVRFINNLVVGKTIRYVMRQIKAPFVPRTIIGNIAQKGIKNR